MDQLENIREHFINNNGFCIHDCLRCEEIKKIEEKAFRFQYTGNDLFEWILDLQIELQELKNEINKLGTF